MIDGNNAAEDLCATEIVNGQVAAPLVLVLQKCKTLALAGLFVADHVEIHRLAIL